METNNFALYKGKIVYVPDVPKLPIKRDSFESYAGTVHMGGDFGYEKAMKKYSEALQSAIASGIEVENQDVISEKLFANHKHKINASYGEWVSQAEGKLYTLQCRVEIFPSDKGKVARVTFEQPEKKKSESTKNYILSIEGGKIKHSIADAAKKISQRNKVRLTSKEFEKFKTERQKPEQRVEPEAAGQEQETQEQIFDDMFCQYFDLFMNKKLSGYHTCLEIQKRFTITRKR